MVNSMNSMIALALVMSLQGGGAFAQDAAGCDQFKWSIARERGWFAAGIKPAPSGATIDADQGYAVALAPAASVTFRVPPERALKPGAFAATLALANIEKAGRYQITVSGEAWLDIVQGDAAAKAIDFSAQKNCPGVRKSVRFFLKSGPAIVQISNAASATINLAIAPTQ
jgi:hypothetical protein